MLVRPKSDITGCGKSPDRNQKHIQVKRCHGLGNVICLLPVLDRLDQFGHDIDVITRPQWIKAFSELRPQFQWLSEATDPNKLVDLDDLTSSSAPATHRTDEFAELLGVDPPFEPLRLQVPPKWLEPFELLKNPIVFAPEGGHSSRRWPTELAKELAGLLPYDKLVLVGLDPDPAIPCDLDTRGQLQLTDLFGLIARGQAVITMDSAVQHIAMALAIPTVTIFGGINPDFRIRKEHSVVVIQSPLDCCPCNKTETCSGRFPCISWTRPQDVVSALEIAKKAQRRIIYKPNSPADTSSLVEH